MTTVIQRQNWQMLRHMVAGQGRGALLIGALFVVLVAAVTLFIASVGDVTYSVWEQATQVPRWYAGGMGVCLTALYLPLYIAHGETRRDFMVQSAIFSVGFAVALAALVTIGFLLEAGFYRLAGWSQELGRHGLFSAADEVGRMLATFSVVYLGWVAGGAFVGAVYTRYRPRLYGLPLFGLAVVPAALVEAAVGSEVGPVGGAMAGIVGVTGVISRDGLPLLGALAAGAGAYALALAMTWPLVRDVAVRNKSA